MNSPEGFLSLCLSNLIIIIIMPYALAAFTSRKYYWNSFLLEAVSISGPQCGRNDYVNENFQ